MSGTNGQYKYRRSDTSNGLWDPTANIDVKITDPDMQIPALMGQLFQRGDLRGIGWTAQGVNTERSAQDAFDLLRGYSSHDTTYDTGKLFNTECASPHPLALVAHAMFADRNALKEQHSSVRLMEEGMMNWFAELLHHPRGGYEAGRLDDIDVNRGEIGYLPGGGTAANIVAFWAMRNYDRLHGRGRTKILIPEDAHYSKLKLEDLLGLEPVPVGISSNYDLDMGDLRSKMDGDVLGIYATAGTSRLGIVQPIMEIGEIAQQHGSYVHVDAAFGGYVLPFMEKLGYDVPVWDFRVPGVTSITLDPHKMGMTSLGAGAIIFRSPDFVDAYRAKIDFPKTTNFTLEGSRGGGPVAAAYFMAMYFGVTGYMETVKRMIDQRDLFVDNVLEIPGMELFREPNINAVGITLGSLEGNAALRKGLEERGYQISGLRREGVVRFIFHADHQDSDIIQLTDVIADLALQINASQHIESQETSEKVA